MSVIHVQRHTFFRVILRITLLTAFLVTLFTVTETAKEDAYARSLNTCPYH